MADNGNSHSVNQKDEEVIDTQIQRILFLFDKKNKHFQIVFYLTLAFGLAFLFFSILPAVYIQNELYSLEKQLEETLLRFQQIESGTDNEYVKSGIRNSSNELMKNQLMFYEERLGLLKFHLNSTFQQNTDCITNHFR